MSNQTQNDAGFMQARRTVGEISALKCADCARSDSLVEGIEPTSRIPIPAEALAGADDVFLKIRWIGDVARLFAGVTLLDDRYYDGRPWTVALARFKSRLDSPLTVSILPIRGDAPVYFDASAARPSRGTQTAQMLQLALEPSYSLVVEFPKEH